MVNCSGRSCAAWKCALVVGVRQYFFLYEDHGCGSSTNSPEPSDGRLSHTRRNSVLIPACNSTHGPWTGVRREEMGVGRVWDGRDARRPS